MSETVTHTRINQPLDHEPRLILLIDWAREFLATEVEGQYTSDAALQLALAVWLDERSQGGRLPHTYTIKPAEGFSEPRRLEGAPGSTKPGGHIP